MESVHIVLGIWICLVIYSTYGLYKNPCTEEDLEAATQEVVDKVGKDVADKLIVAIYFISLLFDLAMLSTIYYFFETPLIQIAVPTSVAVELLFGYLFLTGKNYMEQLEITRQCIKCFIAVMTAIYIIF